MNSVGLENTKKTYINTKTVNTYFWHCNYTILEAKIL